MNPIEVIALFFFFIIAELIYIGIAKKWDIVDNPNHRTMHTGAVVRGGGIIFLFSLIIVSLFYGEPDYWLLGSGLVLGVISYLDDLYNLPGWLRMPVQLLSVAVVLYSINFIDLSLPAFLIAVVIGAGTLNAFNFMDGINGITALYALVTFVTLWVINRYIVAFSAPELIWIPLCSIIAFSFFNVRKTAVCFAGDIGSIIIGFLSVYLVSKVILATGNVMWIFLLLVYGVDVVITIIQRIENKEDIFDAHKKHLFQFLVDKRGWSHLRTSVIYALTQLIVNALLIWIYVSPLSPWWSVLLLTATVALYLSEKYKINGSVWLS